METRSKGLLEQFTKPSKASTVIQHRGKLCQGIKRFILFHNRRHPIEMGCTEITSSPTCCAGKRQRLTKHCVTAPDHPAVWFLTTNLPDQDTTLRAYKRRMWIKEMFGDWQGHGVDVEKTRLGH